MTTIKRQNKWLSLDMGKCSSVIKFVISVILLHFDVIECYIDDLNKLFRRKGKRDTEIKSSISSKLNMF